MSHSFTNINLHVIFHVKHTGCKIKEEDLPRLFHYIGGTIRAMSGYAHMVGGRPDHLHVLTSLPLQMSLADFVRSIKANASRWMKDVDSCYQHFAWQEGYGAFSVSESNKDAVIRYILNQEYHHQHQTAVEEFQCFLRKNGIFPQCDS